MDQLVDELVDVLEPALDRPFALHGASMGARVVWALAHALRDLGLPSPERLYLACDPAPSSEPTGWAWEQHPDGLLGYVRDLGGTPPEVLAEPTLLAALLPVLDADLTMLRDHDFRPDAPLDVPIQAFAAADDPDAPPARMEGWRQQTTAAFTLETLESGHFLNPRAEARVAQVIGADLGRVPTPLNYRHRNRHHHQTGTATEAGGWFR